MANKKKSKFLSKFLTPNENVVAVDVGSRYVKIAVLHKKKDVIESTVLDAEPIPYLSARGDISPEQVSSALAVVLERNNIKNGSFISMLPLEFVSVKRFDVPSVSAKQIEQIVPFEAEKHLPFSLERAVIDFDFIPLENAKSLPDNDTEVLQPTSEKAIEAQKTADALESAGNKSMVTLAAVRLAVIPKFLELCKVKGCRQNAIDVTAFALYNSLSFFLRKNPPDPDAGDIVLIEVGARRTEIIVISAKTGELLFTRSINFGGDALTEAITSKLSFPFEQAEKIKCEKWGNTGITPGNEEYNAAFEPLFTQLKSTLRYIKKSGLSPLQSKIYVSGGASATPGIAECFQSEFALPVEIFNPLPMINAGKSKAVPQMFTSVIGGALRMINEAKINVDLLPVDITKLQLLAVRKKRLIQLGIIAGMVITILLLIFGVKVLLTDIQRRSLRSEYKRLAPEALKVDSLEKRNETLRIAVNKMEGLTDRKTSWSTVLKTLAGSMNSNIWVNKLSVDKKNYLTIDAYSIGMEYLEFKNQLAGSVRFDDVQIVNSQNDRSGRFKIFKLKCKVIPDYKYDEEFDSLRKKLLEKLSSLNSGEDLGQIINEIPEPQTNLDVKVKNALTNLKYSESEIPVSSSKALIDDESKEGFAAETNTEASNDYLKKSKEMIEKNLNSLRMNTNDLKKIPEVFKKLMLNNPAKETFNPNSATNHNKPNTWLGK